VRPELHKEIERLKAILASHGKECFPDDPVAEETLARIEGETGIVLDPDVKEFYRFSNGSCGEVWGAVETDRLVPMAFPMLEEAYEQWALFAPYDDSVYEEWNLPEGDERDPRVQPAYLRHRLWFPIAESDGYCITLLFDADPTEQGKRGQILAFQCEPGEIRYAADGFLELLRQSNDLLEARGAEVFFPPDPELDAPLEDADGLKDDLRKIVARLRDEETPAPRNGCLDEVAGLYGYTDAASFLFGHDEGQRIALELAVINNQPEVVECLITSGASVDTRDGFSDTPLMTAAGCGHEELVRLLLRLGADVSARNEEGETAVDKARRKGHASIVGLLEEAEAARPVPAPA